MNIFDKLKRKSVDLTPTPYLCPTHGEVNSTFNIRYDNRNDYYCARCIIEKYIEPYFKSLKLKETKS